MDRPAGERVDFLMRACAGDEELRKRVKAMLDADEETDLLIDHNAFEAASALLPSAESEIYVDKMIGEYRLIRELGRGGMGVVYLAFDTRLERRVALKLLPARLTNDPERVRRFQREARTASGLNHPNIITIHDFGQVGGRFYIVSEFVEGRTLRDFINKRELTISRIVDVAIQVAGALEAAHDAAIVHRDVKPENIMLRPDGYAKVLDFGLAKLTEPQSGEEEADTKASDGSSAFETHAGAVLGTVNYMSPEQARGQKVDGRSDLFSLGVVLYELISGRRPFGGPTRNHTLVAIMDNEPPPIAERTQEAPERLQEILNRTLAKDRENRFQTAREMIVELEALQSDLVVMQRLGGEGGTNVESDFYKSNADGADSQPTSSEVYISPKHIVAMSPGALKKRMFGAAAAIIITVVATFFYFNFSFGPARPALTGQDAILLTDFVNTTGDAVFDGTLKHGLEAQLAQSPYLNIFPDERARETLRLMGRSRDDKITRAVGREICQRRGIKALLVGEIASLGRNYVITLEAINSQSGEAIARQQVEAEGKEQVLRALGRAATELRGKLGESLASIRKFDAPIEQATTASLEALKNYSAGIEAQRRELESEAVTLLKRAIEMDDKFALAYLQLGVVYRDMRDLALGNQCLERAYQLRERVSERERQNISATYFRHITGELDKRIETSYLLTQIYPQDPASHHIHGNSLLITGQYAQAADAYATAVRLDADYVLSRSNLALSMIGMNRFDEARQVIEQGLAGNQDSSGFHNRLYLIAFVNGDQQAMNRHIEWGAGKRDEYLTHEIRARSFAFAGQRRQASVFFRQAASLAEVRGLIAEKARIMANEANMNATFGLTGLARTQAAAVLSFLGSKNIAPTEMLPSTIQQLELQPPAWTLALCGETAMAKSLADELARSLPRDTLINRLWLPLIRATIELKRGRSARPDQVIDLLQPARQYEAAASFRPTWARGQAYLQLKDGALASAEFQRIIEHRGWDVLSPLWPLAHLGVARAAATIGDMAKSREMYRQFFSRWEDADADLPVLIDAKREYEKLK